MWVGDGVGGLLGGDKAYRKLAIKHHPDKMKRSMKVEPKVIVSWIMDSLLSASLECLVRSGLAVAVPAASLGKVSLERGRARGCLCWANGPLTFLEALHVLRVCSRLFSVSFRENGFRKTF